MFRTLTRTAMTGAATAALIGAALLLAPAAEAAPHSTSPAAGIGAGAEHQSFSFKVGDHRDRLTLDAIGSASKRVTIAGTSRKLAAEYRVRLSRGKHVLLTRRASTYPALLASFSTATGRSTSDARARATVVRALALPVREAKAGVEATIEQLDNESTAVVAAADVVLDVQRWRSEHPDSTTLEGYSLPEQSAHVGGGLGADLSVSGTPQEYTVRAVIAANGAVYKVDSNGDQRYSRGFLAGRALKNELR